MCIPNLDDAIVFSATLSEHIEHLRKVPCRLKSYGVKLKPRKCALFKQEVSFLGIEKATSAAITMKNLRP